MFNRALALALTTGALSGAPLPALAGEPGATLAVSLTLTAADTAAVELTLTIADTHGCASVQEKRRDAGYEVSVCRDGGDDDAPILAFDVERVINTEHGSEQRRFRVKSRLAVGKPVRVARYGEGKSALEVTASLARVAPRT